MSYRIKYDIADRIMIWSQSELEAVSGVPLPRQPHYSVSHAKRYTTHACRADVAAYGACILPVGHDGLHKDASGHRVSKERTHLTGCACRHCPTNTESE